MAIKKDGSGNMSNQSFINDTEKESCQTHPQKI